MFSFLTKKMENFLCYISVLFFISGTVAFFFLICEESLPPHKKTHQCVRFISAAVS